MRAVALAFGLGFASLIGHSCAAQSDAPAAAADAAAPAPLAGAAAWAAVVGNTVVADSRAGSYTEFFASDGTIKHLDKDGKADGTWTLQADKICFDFPDDDDRICTAIEVAGSKGAFIDQDGGRDAFAILPGNAKGL